MSEFNLKENHLKGQTSPYLLQHLYNPVDWYPWGPEALDKAKTENKPLLISIGYSACHWCHVMEKESFEDHEVARLMNDHFVCIKVDREERPDIDHLYMNAVQLISQRGGWPLNCFALPDGRPFWGATYFPRDQWKSILIRIHELFVHQHSDLEEQAEKLTEGLAQNSILPLTDKKDKGFSADVTNKMARGISQNIDMNEGGTMGAPKFPLPAVFEFLLHYHQQNPQAKDAAKAVELTLTKMAMGGIYDQAGGGFARYSVDENWKVPHFEKMLYDNAQLISLYAKAYKTNPLQIYRQVVEESIAFVKRELTSPSGTFYSALDADSEGEEGKFYVWTEKQFHEVLGKEAPLAIEYFNVGGKGFWEKGNSILLLNKTDEAFAREWSMQPEMVRNKAASWKKILLKEREKRIRPGLDNKVLVSWNGLMIEALAEAYSAFGNHQWKDDAAKAADNILRLAMQPDGRLYHTLNDDKPAVDGFLEDYACMIKALIKLGTHKEEYLLSAKKMMEYTLENFSSEKTNMFSFSSAKGEQLVAPYFDFQDNVIPSANSIMARNLFYMGHLFENHDWIDRSRQMLTDVAQQMENYGSWTANWGILWLHHQKEFFTLAVCGNNAAETTDDILSNYLPDILACSSFSEKTQIPLLKNRFVKGKTLVYPCTSTECLPPVATSHETLKILTS
ncbi:MAG: thioredoxin domain-containing protein [Bacteroidetes bacterium]|nr:MAG: thioredoxin domain-containing protein [Bacteroidota bacterium]